MIKDFKELFHTEVFRCSLPRENIALIFRSQLNLSFFNFILKLNSQIIVDCTYTYAFWTNTSLIQISFHWMIFFQIVKAKKTEKRSQNQWKKN